jgi:hypothetical protein
MPGQYRSIGTVPARRYQFVHELLKPDSFMLPQRSEQDKQRLLAPEAQAETGFSPLSNTTSLKGFRGVTVTRNVIGP